MITYGFICRGAARTRCRGAGLGLILLVSAGCGQDPVRVYQAPKDPRPTLPAGPSDSRPMAEAARTAIAWTVPQGWTDKGASGMRAGSFAVAGPNNQKADVSVIAMQTWSGQEVDNVNRWRAQVGLARITPEELPQHTTRIRMAGTEAPLFEMAGTSLDTSKPSRILAAVLPLPRTAYYFKMSGDDALVAAQKATFVGFLQSVRIVPPAESSP